MLENSVVGAPFVRYKRAAFLDPATPTAMSLALVAKDLRLITDMAARCGLPVTEQTPRGSRPPSTRGWAPGHGRPEPDRSSSVSLSVSPARRARRW